MISHVRAMVVLTAAVAAAACTPTDRTPAGRGGQRSGATAQVATTAAADTGSLSGDVDVADPRPAKTADSSPAKRTSDVSRPVASMRATEGKKAAPARRIEVGGIDLTGVGYDVGDPAAQVVLVNFSDFGCPYCAAFARETYPALEREYVRTGKVYFKYVPFVMGMFRNAAHAARAAECAADEGQFWPMHDRLYVTQAEWKSSVSPYEQAFRLDARALGIDAERFRACYVERRTDARTATATELADRLRIRATPSFFVNGRLVEGALPLAQFREVLDGAIRGVK